MIHTFSSCGCNLALDVGSGALHALDTVAFEALRLREQGHADGDIVSVLASAHSQETVTEALAELDELYAQGLLGTPDDCHDMDKDAISQGAGLVKAMCLHAAHDCNLRCAYCFADTGDFHLGERSLLSFEVGKAALDWLVARSASRHTLEVDFFGGEPLMNFSVVRRLVEYGRTLEEPNGKRFLFTITTNGLALNDENMDFINREMHNVVLSIDGRPQVHDRMRPTVNGSGSYGLVTPKALELARRRGHKQYYVRGTYTAYNLDFGQDVLALADAGFEQLSIEPVVADPANPYAITADMAPALEAEYECLARVYLERRAEGRWFNFFHFIVDLSGGPCLKKRLLGCGAGNEYVAVTPTGDIYPCHQFVGREDFRMGSVLDGTFDGAMQRVFAENHVLNKPACDGCWAKFLCSGGCAANAYAFHGNIREPYELECALQRKRLECAMAIWTIEKG
ncbi:MAG: thioether cross-link-forming SCIFF peptide maturase [Clostridia bacterium]|nr:thioether cross-link-forming SCIFF peptide maturase [Clostridia bacterium]